MRSIHHKVLFVLVGACLIPSVILLWVTNQITGDALEKSEFAKIEGVGAEVARQVAASMEATDSSLEILRSNRTLQNPGASKEERIDVMTQMVNAFKRFSDITVYAPDGYMTETTTEGSHPEPVENTSWFERARDTGEIVTSTPHRVRGVEGLHIKVYIPVRIQGWEKPHVLKARVPFESVWSRIEGAKLGGAGMIVLMDSRGTILYHPDKTKVLTSFDSDISPGYWKANRRTDYTDPAGEKFIYWATSILKEQSHVGEQWTLVALLPRAEVNAAIRHSQLLQLTIGFVTVIVAMGVGGWMARGFAKPLILASEAAKQVAGGNLQARLPEETGSTEIRHLSASFNMMIDEVREHRDKLSSLVRRRTRKLRESELSLKKTSAMLLASYEATQEAVLVVDPDGCVVAANQHLGEFFGIDSASLPGQSIDQLKGPMGRCFETPELFSAEWDRLAGDPQAYAEDDWALSEPQARKLSIYSAPVTDGEGVLCARLWMFRDTTEQHRLQEGLQQAQKMEAVGQLAGGVAHDFNNLLTGIIGNLSLAEMGGGFDNGETPEELIASAKGAGERAAELVKQLLGFSRRTHLKVDVGDCNKVIGDVDLLLRRTFDPSIKIVADPEKPLWGAKVDLNMIEQVVMNMVVNAKDAMPGGGTITMKTRNVTLVEKNTREGIAAEPGDYVVLTVADDGEGMSPEVLQKVYEPFFTTKEQGKGTGLGLATSYGIIRQHGGWIECNSKVGEGTIFTIYLPRAIGSAAKDSAAKPESSIEDRRGSETILLVDDEKVVRTVAQSVLRHHGYKTIAAEDGLVALEVFEKGDDVDLVLLDLTMPNLSGAETFKRIRAEFGDVPVIVCSGYTVNLDEFEAENGARPNGFLQKPYNIADLAQQVRETLNQACLSA